MNLRVRKCEPCDPLDLPLIEVKILLEEGLLGLFYKQL